MPASHHGCEHLGHYVIEPYNHLSHCRKRLLMQFGHTLGELLYLRINHLPFLMVLLVDPFIAGCRSSRVSRGRNLVSAMLLREPQHGSL